jgi:hypothetical protein
MRFIPSFRSLSWISCFSSKITRVLVTLQSQSSSLAGDQQDIESVVHESRQHSGVGIEMRNTAPRRRCEGSGPLFPTGTTLESRRKHCLNGIPTKVDLRVCDITWNPRPLSVALPQNCNYWVGIASRDRTIMPSYPQAHALGLGFTRHGVTYSRNDQARANIVTCFLVYSMPAPYNPHNR